MVDHQGHLLQLFSKAGAGCWRKIAIALKIRGRVRADAIVCAGMGGTAFLIIAGALGILLGRWMYRNPTKVYPHWVESSANSQFFRRFFRGFGLVIIFAGCYSAIVAIVSMAFSPVLAVALAVILGLIAAYLLRPKLALETGPN